jgi:hypothetical protein
MKTFNKFNLTYKNIVDAPNEILIKFFNCVSRFEVINWLSWNDTNGIYQDKESKKEFGNTLTKEEAILIMKRQINDNK